MACSILKQFYKGHFETFGVQPHFIYLHHRVGLFTVVKLTADD